MHKHHLVGCGSALVAAVVVFAATGRSVGGLGLVLAALICPIAMGGVMWFLMGSKPGHHIEANSDADPSVRETAPAR